MIISDGLPIPGVTWVAVVGHGCCKPTGATTNTIAEYIVFVEMETHDTIFARLALASERAGPVWFGFGGSEKGRCCGFRFRVCVWQNEP